MLMFEVLTIIDAFGVVDAVEVAGGEVENVDV